jgi:hypothetical protein
MGMVAVPRGWLGVLLARLLSKGLAVVLVLILLLSPGVSSLEGGAGTAKPAALRNSTKGWCRWR